MSVVDLQTHRDRNKTTKRLIYTYANMQEKTWLINLHGAF